MFRLVVLPCFDLWRSNSFREVTTERGKLFTQIDYYDGDMVYNQSGFMRYTRVWPLSVSFFASPIRLL